ARGAKGAARALALGGVALLLEVARVLRRLHEVRGGTRDALARVANGSVRRVRHALTRARRHVQMLNGGRHVLGAGDELLLVELACARLLDSADETPDTRSDFVRRAHETIRPRRVVAVLGVATRTRLALGLGTGGNEALRGIGDLMHGSHESVRQRLLVQDDA